MATKKTDPTTDETTKAPEAPATVQAPIPDAPEEQRASRATGPVWEKKAPAEFIDVLHRCGDAIGKAMTPDAVLDLLREAVREGAAVLADPGAIADLPTGHTVTDVVVPGEGTFAVAVNQIKKVELVALVSISGTGIQKTDHFGEDPVRAIRLVLAGAAAPRLRGGVRRKGAIPAGELDASV